MRCRRAPSRRNIPASRSRSTPASATSTTQKINEQLKAKKLDADLAILQTVSDSITGKRRACWRNYRPEGSDPIDQTFKDPDGHFIGVFVTAVSYAYNPQLVKPADVPKSAMDFLKPEFRGKMISCYPHDDDITLYLFYTLVDRYGWDWMDKYLANGASFIQGHLGVSRSISSGESMVTIDSNPNLSLREKHAGKPMAIAFSEVDPTPIWAQTAATFKDFAASERGAAVPELVAGKGAADQALDTWSPRVDMPPPAGIAAAVLAEARQQLSGFHERYKKGRRSAQAFRGLDRAGAEERRRALGSRLYSAATARGRTERAFQRPIAASITTTTRPAPSTCQPGRMPTLKSKIMPSTSHGET